MSDSNPARARFAHLSAIFTDVLERYRTILNLHPLAAGRIDDDLPPNRKLDFAVIDYKTDIENATAASLLGLPDEDKLQKTWFQLVANDQTADLALTKRVIRACGQMYQKRGLEPSRYLRKIKRKHGERVAQ